MIYRFRFFTVTVILIGAFVCGPPVTAQEFEVLTSFYNPPLSPTGGLTIGPDGFYGASLGGGSFDYGSIFRFIPPDTGKPGSVTKLYSFPDTDYTENLGRPIFGLVLASDGNFYGIRTGGGWSGYTAVYRITPAGEQSLFYFFQWPGDGGNPEGPLVEYEGALYGTCRWGGDPAIQSYKRKGIVFRLELNGTFTRLHTFTGGDGDRPEGGLVVGQDGFLYGTTSRGGQFGGGTIFRIDPESGELSTLYNFQRSYDGSGPSGELTVGPGGVIYGAATYGDSSYTLCGTLFQFDPNATADPFSVLHTFACTAGETKSPNGGMVVHDGYLYGTTYGDDIDWRYGEGVVFRFNLETKDFEILWSHDPEEAFDGALVLTADGFIYGQGRGRGPYSPSAGLIFRIDPTNGNVEILHDFGASPGPRKPDSVAENASGKIMVTSQFGGLQNRGTIFECSRTGECEVVHEFSDGDLYSGNNFLTPGSDGHVYGTRNTGGDNSAGSIFALDPDNNYQLLHSFDASVLRVPAYPYAALIESRFKPGTFYGTLSGGWGIAGGVYEFDRINGTKFLAQFNFETGIPRGRLVQTGDGSLYGVIHDYSNITGGYIELGGLFKVSPNGGGGRFRKLWSYEGQTPVAGMVERQEPESGETFLYGTAPSGGEFYDGTIFKLNSAEELTVVHSFSGEDGAEPRIEMALAGDGNIYGTTETGGLYGYGTIFALTSEDIVVTVHHFDHNNGAHPKGALYVGSDGNLYGTGSGGPDGGGVVFRFNLAPRVTLSEAVQILEGDATTISAAAEDPQGTAVSYDWDLDGDGQYDDGSGPSVEYVADLPERDGPGGYSIAVRVTDESGVATIATTSVTVANVAPMVSISPETADAAPGSEISFDVTFIDPGPDTWSATVDWGDGTVENLGPVSSPFTISHTFADPGSYNVAVTVSDDDGGEGVASANINADTVNNVIEELITDVRELIDNGDIPSGRGRNLIGELMAALFFLRYEGGEVIAIMRIRLFIFYVENLMETEQVDPEVGNDLLTRARAIIEMLQ